MNRAYRLVWSQFQSGWIVVAETTKGIGKASSRSKLLLSTLLLASSLVQAAPTGGQVIAGSAQISQSGNTTTITQQSTRADLNWQSFNININETVNFLQPSATALAVNRIFSNDGSQIMGHLNANGQVYLINPNGIIFGQGSQVNVGGLVASTLDNITTNTNGTVTFSGNGKGSIVNQGNITANSGGYVALLANQVSNQGIITAQLGTVALGAGSAATLTFNNNQLLHLQIDQSTLNNLTENKQLIQADGGQVIMSAGAKDSLLASVVNNTGAVQAQTVDTHNGTITLLAGMTAGTTKVDGTLDASAPNGGNGGFIETSAAHINIADTAKVTTLAPTGITGTWLIDPNDYTVAATGGDQTGAQLTASLATTNVTLLSSSGATSGSGNININDTMSWSANNLTLTAANNINVNAVMTATGTASLNLNPATANASDAAVNGGTINMGLNNSGFYGKIDYTSSGPLFINGTQYTVINSLGSQGSGTGTDLQGINGDRSGHYVLGSNIDASSTSTWNSGAGFTPLGNCAGSAWMTCSSQVPFTGIFNGFGHTIDKISIQLPIYHLSGTGFFGVVGNSGIVSNVGVSNANVNTGSMSDNTAVLAGFNYGSIFNSYTSGTVYGGGSAAGLVGVNAAGRISNSFTTANVDAYWGTTGGLAAYNSGYIYSSHSSGSVTGQSSIGGLVGINDGGSIASSYATGNINHIRDDGINNMGYGGLVGTNANKGLTQGTITNSYATGNVNGWMNVGGLVGSNSAGASIQNSYATGNVIAADVVGYWGAGGFVGANLGSISNSYSTGNAIGNTYVGGFVGSQGFYQNYTPSIANSYSTGSAGGLRYVGGFIGLNYYGGLISNSYSKGLASYQSTFSGGFDFADFVGQNDGVITNSFALNQRGNFYGENIGGNPFPGHTFSFGLSNTSLLNSTQINQASNFSNYDFTSTWVIYEGYTSPLLRSFMTPLIVSANSISKVYNSVIYTGGSGVSYSLTPNANLLGTVNYSGTSQGAINVGSYTLTPGGLYSNQQGYLISYASGSLTINPATLTYVANAATSTYGSTPSLNGGSVTGFVNTDNLANATTGELAFNTLASATTNVGSYAINGSGLAANHGNYVFVQDAGNATALTINPATLTYVANAATSTYGSTPSLNGGSVTGFVNTDNLANATTGELAFNTLASATTNVGSYAINGSGLAANHGNYVFVQDAGNATALTINPKALTVINSTVANKVYDGSTSATVTGGTLVGVVNGDSITLNQSGTFATQNVGTAIAVTATDSLVGNTLGNYTLTQPTLSAANITPRVITLTGTRAYDGTTTATAATLSASNLVLGDTLTLTGSVTLAAKNVGTQNITVKTALVLSGNSNYTLTGSTGSVIITPKALTVTGTKVANKVYNGTTAATLSGGVLAGVVTGDRVTLTQAGSFASKNVGTGIAVTAADTITGTGAANYILTQPTGLIANITPKALTVTGTKVANKVYDGTTTATVTTGVLSGLIAGDVVTLTQAGTFSSKNAATGIAVTIADTISGAGASNYTLTQPTGLKANITPRPLILTGTRLANGSTTVAAGVLSVSNLVANDVLTLGGSVTIASAFAGTRAITSFTALTLTGASATNYTKTGATGTVTIQ